MIRLDRHQYFNEQTPGQTFHARRRGTAMMETLLIIPIIIFFLLTIFLIARLWDRHQGANVMDRYASWQRASYAPRLEAYDDTEYRQGLGNPQMNQMFFSNKASTIFLQRDSLEFFPDLWQAEFIAHNTQDVKDYINAYFLSVSHDNLPSYLYPTTIGSTAEMTTRHAYAPPDSTITHSHTRLGDDWTYASGWMYRNPDRTTIGLDYDDSIEFRRPYHGYITASNSNILCETFYLDDLDNYISPLRNSGNRIARFMQNIYLSDPSYRGPTISR